MINRFNEVNMDNKLSILLVEDDQYACKQIINLADNSEDMLLVGVTNNAFKAIDYIRDTLPDVVILDLELHQGTGSGLNVLSGIKDMSLSKVPYILITTNNSSAVTYESARQLGADYIMSKHQEGYSEKSVIDFLRMLTPVIKSRKQIHKYDSEENESPVYYQKRTTRRIIAELNLIGVNQKSVGYKYLTDAIMITIKEPTQNLCSVIAKKYGKTECSVERAMQNAINRTWATSSIDDLLANYTAKISSSKGVPTLTEFIFYYANKIKNEY